MLLPNKVTHQKRIKNIIGIIILIGCSKHLYQKKIHRLDNLVISMDSISPCPCNFQIRNGLIIAIDTINN